MNLFNIKHYAVLLASTLSLAAGEKNPPFATVAPSYKLEVPAPALPFEPKVYACSKALTPIKIDGVLDEEAWKNAPWSDLYVDIEGSLKPTPTQQTRCKMCWDDTYFYIAAELKETDLWATLTKRDSIIFFDNDFEVFIDPDSDNHHYYELEVNALNTVWDLLLVKPYREGGPAIHGWDIAGLKTAVTLQGTLNDPSDVDQGWKVEIAIPFKTLKEASATSCPPQSGDRWKVNFSRVQWSLNKAPQSPHGYTKKINKATGKPLPEHNWVWSPQGLISMHYPERWGIVEFYGPNEHPKQLKLTEEDHVREALMQAYYQLRLQQQKNKPLALSPMSMPEGWSPLKVESLGYIFRVQTHKGDTIYSINHQSLIQKQKIQ